MNSISSVQPVVNSGRSTLIQNMELAARHVDKSLFADNAAPSLLEHLKVTPQTVPSASGLTDTDYAILGDLSFQLLNCTQIRTHSKVPLPAEIKEHFNRILFLVNVLIVSLFFLTILDLQCHCMMGLFAEIHRAWLTIDTDIYMWTYEESTDIAYYDGLNETILCVGLIQPKPGVLHSYIKYLLILSTASEIIVLGVSFVPSAKSPIEEIHLISDPVFTVSTDGAVVSTFAGSKNGRLFFGTKDGSLYEIAYQVKKNQRIVFLCSICFVRRKAVGLGNVAKRLTTRRIRCHF